MFTLLYVGAVVLTNLLFVYVPVVSLPDGGIWSAATLVAGLVLVSRDFAQKELGHYVWAAMIAAAILSYLFANPSVAVASVVAFLLAEAVDWAVYSYTRKPLSQRVLLSSLLAAPVDTLVFLTLIGQPSLLGGVVMTASKLAGAVLVATVLERRAA